jgi:hypothetical protein
MYIHIADGSALVCNGDDCTSLDVRVASQQRDTVDPALRASGLGRWDGSAATAEIDLAALHSAAAASAIGQDWSERWDRMVAYAARHDWLTTDGRGVHAHFMDAAASITDTSPAG